MSEISFFQNIFDLTPNFFDFNIFFSNDYTKCFSSGVLFLSFINNSINFSFSNKFNEFDIFLTEYDPEFLSYIDNVASTYHSSVPTVKLYYPEPFIASPTFIHEDI